MLAVVKANAYGHGAEICAVMLARAGARWLGVTCASEGARVREALDRAGFGADASISPDILVMSGFLPEDVDLLRARRLTPVLWTEEQVGWVEATGLRVHVEVDTGMARQGVLPGADLDALLAKIGRAKLSLDGLFTHLSSAEEAYSPRTHAQERRFEAALAQTQRAGLRPMWVHVGNSSAIDNPAENWPWLEQLASQAGARAMVRPGLALYGFCLPIEADVSRMPIPKPRVQFALHPVMTWKARVLAVRELVPGETVGYNATFTAERPMRVALLPVGYADGLRRELSSTNQRAGGWVMLHAQRARILGRISMNLTVVDVTGIADVRAGDDALVLGEGITAEDHARLAATIVYEIICGVHPCG